MEGSHGDVDVKKRVAVYLCGCKGEISRHIDLESIVKDLEKDPSIATVLIHEALCSREGQKFLKEEYSSQVA
jgi:heterodisulfide reductase subunit A-like polyferredoxin